MGPRTLVCLFLSTLAAGGVDRHPWSSATRLQTPHYRVETNTWPELARDLGATLERARTLFAARFGPLPPARRAPMRVGLFRGEEDYRRHGGGVRGAVGHFDAALDRCSIAWDGAASGGGWPVAVHEACHHYLWRLHPDLRLPGWYAEGIACYYEGVIGDTSPAALARMRLRAARAALEAGQADLELLLRARVRVHKGRLSVTNLPPVRFYGLAWSLVHFLARDRATRERFRRFELRLLASRPSPSAAAARARRLLARECGSLSDLQRAWRAHIASLPGPAALAPRRSGPSTPMWTRLATLGLALAWDWLLGEPPVKPFNYTYFPT
ncbi:MAG: hypothetical protein ACE5JG_11310, partial [Planctomycetota bacterium]